MPNPKFDPKKWEQDLTPEDIRRFREERAKQAAQQQAPQQPPHSSSGSSSTTTQPRSESDLLSRLRKNEDLKPEDLNEFNKKLRKEIQECQEKLTAALQSTNNLIPFLQYIQSNEAKIFNYIQNIPNFPEQYVNLIYQNRTNQNVINEVNTTCLLECAKANRDLAKQILSSRLFGLLKPEQIQELHQKHKFWNHEITDFDLRAQKILQPQEVAREQELLLMMAMLAAMQGAQQHRPPQATSSSAKEERLVELRDDLVRTAEIIRATPAAFREKAERILHDKELKQFRSQGQIIQGEVYKDSVTNDYYSKDALPRNHQYQLCTEEYRQNFLNAVRQIAKKESISDTQIEQAIKLLCDQFQWSTPDLNSRAVVSAQPQQPPRPGAR